MKTLNETFAAYFKEVIYGGIDGIVTTFAVVAGFAGAALSSEATTQLSFFVVLLFGLANLFADAASMGLGNFLSVRSEKELYRAVRKKEQAALTGEERSIQFSNTLTLLQERGFAESDAKTLAQLYTKNDEFWLDFLMVEERDMTDPRGENEIFTGLATFLSFITFGSIPLLPFILDTAGDAATAFTYSCMGAFCALVLLGLLKWRVIGSDLVASLVEVVLVGGTAATLAYLVGTFFVI